MKKAIRLTLATTFGVLIASAVPSGFAQPNTQGSVAIVFAVSTTGKCFVELDDRDLNPTGFMAGRSTGWVQVASGPHSFRAEQQPGDQAEIQLEVAPGQRKVLILHTDFISSNKPGRPPKPELRLTALDLLPNSKPGTEPRQLRLFSILPSALTLMTDQLDLTEVAVEPRKLQLAGFKSKVGFVTLTEKTEPPAPEPLISVNFQEPSTFFILLYETEGGKRKAISLEAP